MKAKVVLQSLLGIVVMLNFIFLVTIQTGHKSSESLFRTLLIEGEIDGVHRFQDPVLAYRVLEQLDIFEQSNFTEAELSKFSYYYMSLIPDNDYCKKHRAYMVNHPEVIFTQKNILTSLIHPSLFRTRVIGQVGTDSMPYISSRMSDVTKGKAIYHQRIDLNNFFTFFGMYGDRAVGTQYSCLSQSSNAIQGHSYLFRKDYISEGVVKYANSYEKQPECFNYDKFFPQTWILYQKEACLDFFKMFNSQEYQDLKEERGGIVYMRKIGANVHEGRGVFPINDAEEALINDMYKKGELCGTNNANNIIQYFIYNPLLLNNKKFDFRIYMLIASSNPVIAYYYDGFLRVSLHEYVPKSNVLGALLTNTALSKEAFSQAATNGTYNGMTEEELKESHLWNFKRLEDYLLQNGIISDPNWLNNYLRPEFKKAMIHLIRMSQKYFAKKSSMYHLFGVDFMLDANLNLWFIEANASPSLEGFSSEMKNHVEMMLIQHYEIIYGLLKSRMKRVIQYVNRLALEGETYVDADGQLLINNLEEKRQVFERITKNYFEPEYEPSPENQFQPIINESFEGEKRYFGLLANQCFERVICEISNSNDCFQKTTN